MHVGIIYYSVTGTTEDFAGRIANGLIKERYNVELIKIKTDVNVTAPGQSFRILNLLDCSRFDFVLFGGPVWAFGACPVVLEAIKKSQGLAGKKFIPFVTMGLPFKFLGGTRALHEMGKVAKGSEASVLPGFIIPKLFHNYKADMD
ncbi:MAG: hypothetical protein N3A65_08075, partial [candidate division WOR-3 bacterium]|nr:hypothetical protein [candidate division WOR-3 bacterium]